MIMRYIKSIKIRSEKERERKSSQDGLLKHEICNTVHGIHILE